MRADVSSSSSSSSWLSRAVSSAMGHFQAWAHTLARLLLPSASTASSSARRPALRLTLVAADALHFCEVLAAAGGDPHTRSVYKSDKGGLGSRASG